MRFVRWFAEVGLQDVGPVGAGVEVVAGTEEAPALQGTALVALTARGLPAVEGAGTVEEYVPLGRRDGWDSGQVAGAEERVAPATRMTGRGRRRGIEAR